MRSDCNVEVSLPQVHYGLVQAHLVHEKGFTGKGTLSGTDPDMIDIQHHTNGHSVAWKHT